MLTLCSLSQARTPGHFYHPASVSNQPVSNQLNMSHRCKIYRPTSSKNEAYKLEMNCKMKTKTMLLEEKNTSNKQPISGLPHLWFKSNPWGHLHLRFLREGAVSGWIGWKNSFYTRWDWKQTLRQAGPAEPQWGKAGRHPWTAGFLFTILLSAWLQPTTSSEQKNLLGTKRSTVYNMNSKSAKGMQEMLSIQCSAKQKPQCKTIL